MLFDGIRDQKLKANWIKTPQPVVIKLMTARCMRDKVPKGDYVIRAGMMDRLVENKLYYKFLEYGERVKEQRMVDKEKEKSKQSQDLQDLSVLLSQPDEPDSEQDDGSKLDDEAEYQNVMAKPLFNTDGDEDEEPSDEEAKRKGVHWGDDVEQHTRDDRVRGQKTVSFGGAQDKTNTGIVALNMGRTIASHVLFGQIR